MTINQIAKAVTDRVLKLVLGGMSVEDATGLAWSELNVEGQLLEAVKTRTYQQLTHTLGATRIKNAGGVARAYDRLLGESSMAKYVGKASNRMKVDVKSIITKATREGQSIYQTSRAIAEQAVNSPEGLRKEIEALKVDKITAKQADSLIKKIDAGVKGQELKVQYIRLIETARDQGTEKAIQQSKYTMQAKLRSQATRIAMTEQERAYYASKSEKISADPDVKLMKIKLASNHRVPDICDAYARSDMGYGPGVYPMGQSPELPLHPNCGCLILPVYKVTGKPSGDPTTRIEEKARSLGVKLRAPVNLRALSTKIP